MFGSLPELFGKNFLIGYVLPAVVLLAAAAAVCDAHGLSNLYAGGWKFVASGSEKLPLGQFVLALFGVWALAIFLVGNNYALTRLLEGYGALNPARLWRWYSLWRFRRLANVMQSHDDARDAVYAAAARRMAALFPEEEKLVLPTRFGNVLRAAERYPQIVYGMDSIAVWPALQSVAPESHLGAIEVSKAALDFWINLWFASLVIAALAAGLWARSHYMRGIYFAPAALIAAIIAAKLAQSAAADFGGLIKVTFDLYREELCAKLGLKVQTSIVQERKLWLLVSQTMLFRDQDVAADLSKFRDPEKLQPDKPKP